MAALVAVTVTLSRHGCRGMAIWLGVPTNFDVPAISKVDLPDVQVLQWLAFESHMMDAGGYVRNGAWRGVGRSVRLQELQGRRARWLPRTVLVTKLTRTRSRRLGHAVDYRQDDGEHKAHRQTPIQPERRNNRPGSTASGRVNSSSISRAFANACIGDRIGRLAGPAD